MGTTKCVYTGVDYIRLTALDHAPLAAWDAIMLPEFLAEEHAGRKPHHRWMLGYYGRVGEHGFVGRNEDGCMIQLSSQLAWRRWVDATHHSNRCTRIDLQVTYPLDGEPGEYIREMYRMAVLHKTANGRKAEPQLVDTPSGAKMLTIGSRQSLIYGRMYDKFRESKMQEYKSCVRWELEVKAESARDLCAYMLEHKDEDGTTRAIVHNWWATHGVAPLWDIYEGMEAMPPAKRSKTAESKIAWLATQVNPTLQTLQEHGKIKAALLALLQGIASDEKILEFAAEIARNRES